MNETWWVSKDDLIDEQIKVIDLPLEGSYLILGPPGSGKTNLLLLRANYLHLAGTANIAVIVYTRALQEFIQGGASNYDFPPGKVSTSIRWMISLLLEYGRPVPTEDGFEALQEALIGAVEDLVASKGLSQVFDVILLDEAQDFSERQLKLYRSLAKDLFICADSKQKIYKGKDTAKILVDMATSTLSLTHHFRNGLKICAVADEIGKGVKNYVALTPTSNYDESARPSSVDTHTCDNVDEQIALLLTKLDVQRKAYPDEILGICCPTNGIVEKVWNSIQASKFASVAILQKADNHSPFAEGTRICVATIHASKGLEFRTLHLVAMEKLSNFDYQRNIAYTAVTRAKTSLSIYYTGKIPTFLDSALKKLGPLPKLPDVADAFGKGKKK